ncbi:hypothetical protein CN198_14365 [Sinorhizobium meliloti]|uniref:hypothetical protein n=1 Tax=Rhizobium meliloti TaxID=382 RepID=UPI000FD84648|nr:hypothetical protein [Sinorhizobium meliloti]RVH69239.1 hypothetical protein CN198_14365 [Sinorhizobium meliloti]
MTIKIEAIKRETFTPVCTLPLSIENLITAATTAPEWSVLVSVHWDGGRLDRFTLHNLTDRECRQLTTANGPEAAAEIIAKVAALFKGRANIDAAARLAA